MSTPAASPFLIRDGLDGDLQACLSLDATYETDRVLQIQMRQEEPQDWEITLKRERLPRALKDAHPVMEGTLKLALRPEHCLLIATKRGEKEVIGFLAMRRDVGQRLGVITALVVAPQFRRRGLGTRLVGVARTWAKEHSLSRINLEMQTKNIPAVQFCQELGMTFCGYNDRYFLNGDIAVFFSTTLR